jgi:hypothetical protein
MSSRKNLNVNTHLMLETEGSTSTFLVTHMHSDCGAIVVFNNADNAITCSCRKFESIGMCTFLNLNFPLYIYMTMHLHICRYNV